MTMRSADSISRIDHLHIILDPADTFLIAGIAMKTTGNFELQAERVFTSAPLLAAPCHEARLRGIGVPSPARTAADDPRELSCQLLFKLCQYFFFPGFHSRFHFRFFVIEARICSRRGLSGLAISFFRVIAVFAAWITAWG